MKISPKGIKLIQFFETCKLKAYRCPAGVLTIGYGHTGRDVTAGMTITADRANEIFRADLAHFEHIVEQMALPCTQGQFDALVSFAYNCGERNLSSSILLRYHKAGKFVDAANEFLRWNHGGGRVLNGLTARRAVERRLYLS